MTPKWKQFLTNILILNPYDELSGIKTSQVPRGVMVGLNQNNLIIFWVGSNKIINKIIMQTLSRTLFVPEHIRQTKPMK